MTRKPPPKKPKPEHNAEAAARVAASRPKQVRGENPVKARRCRELEEKFLDGLRNSWSVSKSSREAGLGLATVYLWKALSLGTLDEASGEYADDFCVRWIQAHETGVDSLEDEAVRRAKHGVDRPVYQGGVLVGAVTEYSDTLMALVLRGKNPKVYNTERHEHTGRDGAPMDMNMNLVFVPSTTKK